MNVLLINDSSSNPNWGDRAASIALREILHTRGATMCISISETALSQVQYFRFSSASNQVSSRKGVATKAIHLLLPPLFMRISDQFSRLWKRKEDNMAIPTAWNRYGETVERWMRDKDNWIELRRKLESADVVIIHGDGAISSRSNIAFSILFLAYIAKIVMGKPVGIINHTVDPSDDNLDVIVRNLYPSLDEILFRETRSVERCKDFCNGRYVPDTGFWFSPALKCAWLQLVGRTNYMNIWPYQFEFDPTIPYICIGGSSLFYPITSEQISGLQRGYFALTEKIREFWKGQIVFVASDIRDEDILRPVASFYKAPFLPVITPVQQAVDVLGHSAAYIGGRWHSGIFALRGGAPVISLASKTFKMSALCEMAGLDDKPVNAYELENSAAEIASRLCDLLKEGDLLRERLFLWAEKQAIAVTENASLLDKHTNSL